MLGYEVANVKSTPLALFHTLRRSAANLKFLSVSLHVRHRNFKFEAALEIHKLLELP